jgi:hypothetical protein
LNVMIISRSQMKVSVKNQLRKNPMMVFVQASMKDHVLLCICYP